MRIDKLGRGIFVHLGERLILANGFGQLHHCIGIKKEEIAVFLEAREKGEIEHRAECEKAVEGAYGRERCASEKSVLNRVGLKRSGPEGDGTRDERIVGTEV